MRTAPMPSSPHCLGLIEFWIGHVLFGRHSSRDRVQEFTASGPVKPLLTRAVAAQESLKADFDHPFPSVVIHPERGDQISPSEVVQHVLKELFQHLGHTEITRDILLEQDARVRSGTL